MQKTNFPWKVIIADDYSTDGTRDILMEYKNKYPDRVSLILQPKNVGAAKNFLDLMNEPKSDYIAYMEGDDYWIDEMKLEKQMALMRANPKCSLSVHPCYLHRSEYNKRGRGFYKGNKIKKFGISDILKNPGQSSPSASYIFLRDVIEVLPPWISSAPVGDLFIELYSMKLGYGLYMPDIMSAYRVYSQSSWSEMVRKEGSRKLMSYSAEMDKCIGYLQNEEAFKGYDFNVLKSTNRLNVAVGHLIDSNFYDFRKSIFESYAICPNSSQTQKWLYTLRKYPKVALILYKFKKFLDRRSPIKIF